MPDKRHRLENVKGDQDDQSIFCLRVKVKAGRLDNLRLMVYVYMIL